jgi:hypothetical protein
MDAHRTRSQIRSEAPMTKMPALPEALLGTRTPDPFLTMEVLYQLS